MVVSMKAGFPTNLVQYGTGPRPALMIHCTLGHAGAWRPMAVRLGDLLQMTAFDLPGHGKSADWEQPEGLQKAAVEIAADCLDGPADVIGHSFGGTVALRLAVEYPDLVRSLTLIEPVFFAVAFQDRPESRARYDRDLAAYERALGTGDRLAALKAFAALWGDPINDDISAAQKAALLRSADTIPASAAEIMEDSAGLLRSGALQKIQVPVQLNEGAASPIYIRLIHDGLQRRLPNIRRLTVPKAGHMLPLTHPEAVAGAVRRFLTQKTPA